MKMKRIMKCALAALCATMVLAGATACGDSAYEIAVKNGFQGTEAEWLATLQGSDGKDGNDLTAKDLYDTAVENGFQGTYIDFCQNVLKVDVKENNDVDTIAQNVTSVVSIYCGFSKTTYTGGLGGMFGGVMGGTATTSYYSSAGAGVIIDLDKETGDAWIVTNYHVIYDADSNATKGISDSIWLYTYGALRGFDAEKGDQVGDGMKATYVGGAMEYDIAVLRVSGSEHLKNCVASEAKFGNSDEMQVGEKVFAIGNPDGAGIAVTEGIVSVESEYIDMLSSDGTNTVLQYRVMRTDAAINSGNSGGALFNTEGELIGITNAKNASSEVDNMGYSLPGTHVKNLVDNIIANRTFGGPRVAKLGIKVQIVESKAYYDKNGVLKIMEEFQVASVQSGAASGILKVGDSIKGISINGGEWVTFTRQYQLIDQLLCVRKGDSAQLKVVDSNGNENVVSVQFDEDSDFVAYD